MKRVLIGGLATLSLALSAFAVWDVGDTPSDFTCDDWDRGTWNLYDQRGKVVVINFGATW